LELFLFSSGKIFNSNKPQKFLQNQLLSDGFNMAAIGTSIMKSHAETYL